MKATYQVQGDHHVLAEVVVDRGHQAVHERCARVIQVIETKLQTEGDGKTDPIRVITQYWSLDGQLLAVVDPCQEGEQEKSHGRKTCKNSLPEV